MYARFDPSGRTEAATGTMYGSGQQWGQFGSGQWGSNSNAEPVTTPLYTASYSQSYVAAAGPSTASPTPARPNENDGAEDYSRLRKLIDKRFAPYKLNVRRAEVFLRVQKKQLQAMQLYRELVIYAAYITLFFWLAMTILPLHISNDQDDSLVGAGAYFNVPRIGATPPEDSPWDSVNNADDVWGYLKKFVAGPLTGPGEGPAQFRWFRQQIGALRVRQVRGNGGRCEAHGREYSCFGGFTDAGEERAPFGPGGRFQWQGGLTEVRPSPKFMRDDSYAFSYGTGGYVVDISAAGGPEAVVAALSQLQADKFIDEATRVLVVSVNLYNPHTDSYIVAELMAEMPPTGKLLTSVRVETLNIQAFDSAVVSVLGVVFVVFTLGYVLHEFKQARDRGLVGYLNDSWNFWDITNLIIIAWMLVPTLRYRSFCMSMLAALERPGAPSEYLALDGGTRMLRDVKQLAAFAILLCCVRIFKFFELNPRLSVLTNTVGRAVPDLAAYLVIFVIIFAGYAFFAWIVFGYRIEAFRSFYSSFARLFGNLGGGLDIGELTDAAPRAGVFFYFSFIVLVSLILINIFIAIVGKYYTEAGAEAIRSEEEFAKELSEEDRTSPYHKLRHLRVTVLLENEGDEPDRDAHGRPIGGRRLPQGALMRLFISRRKAGPSRGPGTPGTVDPGLFASNAAMPVVQASAAGHPMHVRFLPEVLGIGDECELAGEGGGAAEARLRVERVSAGTDGSWYVDLSAVRESVVSQGAHVRIPWGATLRALASFYIQDPELVMSRRTKKLFEEFGVEAVAPLVPDEALEAQIVELAARNAHLARQADETLKRKSFRLDELLRVIRDLDTLASRHENRAFAEGTTAQLVREAVEIDALYRQAMALGTGQAERLLDDLRRDAEAAAAARRPAAPGALLPAAIRPAPSGAKGAEEKREREVQLDVYRALYARLVAAASQARPAPPRPAPARHGTAREPRAQFDRRVHELWLGVKHGSGKGDGSVLPETVLDSLRFDEVVDIVRAQALVYAPADDCTEVDFKREAVRFLAGFPLACFEPLVQEQERVRPYLPRPFDVDRIADSAKDPARVLGGVRLSKGAPAASSLFQSMRSSSAAVHARFSSPQGDVASQALQKLPDTITDLMAVVIHDGWAFNKIKDGWRHGPGRTKPHHECLVPWRDLEHVAGGGMDDDRNQALNVLRAVVCLGYDFVEPEEQVTVDEVLEIIPGQEEFHRDGRIQPHYWLMRVREGEELPPAMRELVDLLAKNAHDVWAKKRKDEGYTYGEVTDADRKQHSQLIPYECMSDAERSYDKGTAEVTIRMVMACKWRIVPQRRQRSWAQRATIALGIPASWSL
eukprot:tig00001537_g9306.t1